MPIFDKTVQDILNEKLAKIEKHLKTDAVFYYGEIHPSYEKLFRDVIEGIKTKGRSKNDTLTIILNTPGGNAETVEKMVYITRHHYKEVFFIVPDYAMSAGTIFCMSGDKIFMDYSSSLGPIDPQVFNGKEYVPALGYLDKLEEIIVKAQKGTVSNVEILMSQHLDLAMLRSCEQARDLTVALLKDWLVKYKFKNWTAHNTNPTKKGQVVTMKEKQERAEDIAKKLGNNKYWLSHGRSIGVGILKTELRLEIEDYSNDKVLRPLIRSYNDNICEFIGRYNMKIFLHSRYFF